MNKKGCSHATFRAETELPAFTGVSQESGLLRVVKVLSSSSANAREAGGAAVDTSFFFLLLFFFFLVTVVSLSRQARRRSKRLSRLLIDTEKENIGYRTSESTYSMQKMRNENTTLP